MLYLMEKYWLDFYVEYILATAYFRGINLSKDELDEFVFDKEYLNDDADQVYEDVLINTAKALDYIRYIVAKGLDNFHAGGEYPVISTENFKELYCIYEPTLKYINSFDEGSETRKKLDETIGYVLSHLYSVKELRALCENISYSLVDYLSLMPFGEYSLELAWILVQGIMAFKGYGFIVFPDVDDLNENIKLSLELVQELKDVSKTEYGKNNKFNAFVNQLVDASETYHNKNLTHLSGKKD
ncbi:hypothetical protein SCHIN_v1c09540 [Spiroplasma chinense]|uniref:Uncharacterized protein n=1 Tax=Spiroplasma chinense TaxID=216932 RepID=A0A5B9Y770_9MOLU|nr:hypothetical protein [Spiroplasma chinense]QEH62147.1 hypothetical protein SCHIN_v1c09540 [Spiroplasma chinense]